MLKTQCGFDREPRAGTTKPAVAQIIIRKISDLLKKRISRRNFPLGHLDCLRFLEILEILGVFRKLGALRLPAEDAERGGEGFEFSPSGVGGGGFPLGRLGR